MANPQRGEAVVEIDGQPVTLRVTLNTLAEAQDILGLRDFNELMRRLQPDPETGQGAADFVALRALITALLRDRHPNITPQQAAGMIPASDLGKVMEGVIAALQLAFAPAGGEAAESPPKAAA